MRLFLLLLLCACAKEGLCQTDSLKADTAYAHHHVCYSVKTDVISLMNTLIEGDKTSYSLAGGMTFDRRYALQLRFNYFNAPEVNSVSMDMQYIYFIDAYENTILNAGAFCSATNKIFNGEYIKYTDQFLQAGLSGGCSIRFTQHWHLSPSVLLGFPFLISRKIEMGYSRNKPEGLGSKLMLEVGYRF